MVGRNVGNVAIAIPSFGAHDRYELYRMLVGIYMEVE